MIPVPTGVRVWLATGRTDMRRGFPSLSLQVQEVLRRDPLSGHLFCFRGRRGDLLKVIWHDGQGACLSHLHADRDLQAERRRSPSPARRCPQSPSRPPRQPYRRSPAMELEKTSRTRTRRLNCSYPGSSADAYIAPTISACSAAM
jgi:hypothetical protein